MNTTDTKLPSPKSYLFIGPPGGGKTTFALNFPGLWIGDCDNNLDGPLLHRRKLDPAFKCFYTDLNLNADGVRIENDADKWTRMLAAVNEAITEPSVETLFLDSLTHFNEWLLQWSMKKHGIKEMQRQHWPLFRAQLINWIMRYRSCGKTTIVACHEEIKTDSQGNVLRYTPAMSSNLRDYFGYLFTDIYRFDSAPASGGKTAFTVQVTKSPRSDCKNSFGMTGEVKADWAEFKKGMGI